MPSEFERARLNIHVVFRTLKYQLLSNYLPWFVNDLDEEFRSDAPFYCHVPLPDCFVSNPHNGRDKEPNNSTRHFVLLYVSPEDEFKRFGDLHGKQNKTILWSGSARKILEIFQKEEKDNEQIGSFLESTVGKGIDAEKRAAEIVEKIGKVDALAPALPEILKPATCGISWTGWNPSRFTLMTSP